MPNIACSRRWKMNSLEDLKPNASVQGILPNGLVRVAITRSGDLEWVDPVVGARIRHQIAPGRELRLIGDVGGFGAGSEFSWQAVATYGFDVNCFGKPLHTVIGYRALAVDFS